jgi:hypothetical protein
MRLLGYVASMRGEGKGMQRNLGVKGKTIYKCISEPSSSIKCEIFRDCWGTINFPRRALLHGFIHYVIIKKIP